MIAVPLAHVTGIPIEETLASISPALLLTLGAASATLRARLRRTRSRQPRDPQTLEGDAQRAKRPK